MWNDLQRKVAKWILDGEVRNVVTLLRHISDGSSHSPMTVRFRVEEDMTGSFVHFTEEAEVSSDEETVSKHLAAFASVSQALGQLGLIAQVSVTRSLRLSDQDDESPLRRPQSHEQAKALMMALAPIEIAPLPALQDFICHDFKSIDERQREADERRRQDSERKREANERFTRWFAIFTVFATVCTQMVIALFITGSIEVKSFRPSIEVSPIRMAKMDTVLVRDTLVVHDTVRSRAAKSLH